MFPIVCPFERLYKPWFELDITIVSLSVFDRLLRIVLNFEDSIIMIFGKFLALKFILIRFAWSQKS